MSKAGLYFHIPFCLRKCAYCDFCSYTGKSQEEMRVYAQALIREMEQRAPSARDTVFDTLFFGGGTPTLLPTDAFAHVLDKAKELFYIEDHAEITVESNPATADEKKLATLRALGVNRLSVGVQSLSDTELSLLGRLHNACDALDFLGMARSTGFENINVDLMYGIPAQTVESARETLSALLAFAPAHISAYSLILEEGTPLYRRREALPLPDEEMEDAIDTAVRETLVQHGYRHYEISNYAKPGFECRHNLHYWRNEPYLGFGVAAYSSFGGERYGNTSDLSVYIAEPFTAPAERELLTEDALAYEWIMLRLRLEEGLSLSEYRTRFGVDFSKEYREEIERFARQGLLRLQEDSVSLTERGFRLSNAVLVAFMR